MSSMAGWIPGASVLPSCPEIGSGRREGAADGGSAPPRLRHRHIPARSGQAPATAPCQGKHQQPDPFPTAAGARCLSWKQSRPNRGAPSRQQIPSSSRFSLGRMALVLGAVLLAASAAVPPGLPAPRDLARSVLETHGQELRLLKLLGVTRTVGEGWAIRWVQLGVPSSGTHLGEDPFLCRCREATDSSVLFPPPAVIRLGHPFQHQLHRPAARLPQKPP